jgi:hypothetical protein
LWAQYRRILAQIEKVRHAVQGMIDGFLVPSAEPS